MSEADAPAPVIRRRRRPWLLAGKLLAVLLGLVLMLVLAVDTGPGHRFVTDRIAALKPANGLRIRIGRIDGSLFTRATLRDVRLYDTRGLFLSAPRIALDWRPLGWVRNRLDINSLTTPRLRLERLPKFRPTKKGPILPGFDIRIGRLAIERLESGGRAARVVGKADIRHGRALIDLDSASSGGDRLTLLLDAEPDGNRFALNARAVAPTGGMIGRLAGTARPARLAIDGKGTWRVWNGAARADLSGRRVVDLALGVREGRYLLSGNVAPSPFLNGKLQRLSAPAIRVSGDVTLVDRRLSGALRLRTPALALIASGAVDLTDSSFDQLKLDARLDRPPALFPNMTGRDVRLTALLDGPFRTAAFRYAVTAPRLAFDQTGFDQVRANGAGRLSVLPIAVPLKLTARRVTGVGTVAGGILANLSVAGVLKVDAKTLTGSGLALSSDKLKGKLAIRLDLVTGRYDVGVSGGLARYLIPGLGIVDVTTEVSVLPGPGGRGTIVAGRGHAVVRRLDNGFLRSLAGGLPRIETRLVRDTAGIIRFSQLVLTAPDIRITGAGLRRRDGTFQFAGQGVQRSYGAFRMTLDGAIDHPKIGLLLTRPVPALGVAEVRADLDPTAQGFAFRANGRSMLGPFTAQGAILTPSAQPAIIDVQALNVSGTRAAGRLRSDPGGFTGVLDVAGGGLSGRIGFAPAGTIQRIALNLKANGATLATAIPITLRRGATDAVVLLDPAGTSLDGSVSAYGLRRGPLSLARLQARGTIKGGTGQVSATLAGSRGRAFALQTQVAITPDRYSVAGQGTIDGRPVRLDTPAVLARAGAGWQLARTQLTYGGGTATLSGRFGTEADGITATLQAMPMGVLDIAYPRLGLAGAASGTLSYQAHPGAAPSGRADLTIRGLSRSGLILSSQPVDVGLSAVLTAQGLAARAVAAGGGKTIGRMQARLSPLGPGGDLATRLLNAPLFAQLRYAGPADTLWRLTGVTVIDLSGPIAIGADLTGTLADPRIQGSVRTEAGRLESSVSGTVIESVRAQGRFNGSRLVLDTLSGKAGSGTVSGRGAFEFAARNGFGIDLALTASGATLLNRDDIGATVTGPLTLKSDGSGGVIGGDVRIERGRFRLGRAAAASVPRLAVTEINRGEVEAPDAPPTVPWRLALKARASSRLIVTGLGLDSEWRADLTIGGDIDNPAIGGRADLVRGGYQFAGRRFDLDRGTIRFTGAAPPDPVLDITAQASLQGLNATIHVAGTGLQPQIAFESVPALPEDELLSRLLFGTSITSLSAPEALQLAAAVASLRSGGGGGLGLDPINAVRKVAHLDRLRILPADPTIGQRTSVAAGKYIGRKTYIEVVTDGAGYSATNIEFRVTRWLSLLSTVSTIGRQSANVRVSKDY